MFSLAGYAIKNQVVTSFIIILLTISGTICFFNLGRLEDPEFTVKTATITTHYPGANAEQVELEVTDLIEKKIQEMSEVKDISSISRAGLSIIKVNIKNEYWSDRLPQVWDTMRKKIDDIKDRLPPGAETPIVGDDFGYVFGFLLAVTSDGYSYAQLETLTKALQKELSVVKGVARVDLWGVQQKRVYLDISNTQFSQLGITIADLERTLKLQNQVVDSGQVDYQYQRMRIVPTGEFSTVDAIGDLSIIPQLKAHAPQKSDEIIRIRDFALVKEGYIDPPQQLMRYNGLPAIGIALAPLSGVNAIQVGEEISKKIDTLQVHMPRGIEVHKISWQSDIVAESINAFLINLLEAIIIVLFVLAFTMGLRAGMIIGISGLILAILGTFIVMQILVIDLQRVSLGALIIAMGMMVDNAIVVVDGYTSRLRQGEEKEQAAVNAAQISAWPLLGATIVACMAFYPIFSSSYDTGEYAGSLFTVIAVALIFSWVLSQTATPLLCLLFITPPKQQLNSDNEYNSRFYKSYKRLLQFAVHYRLTFTLSMCALLIISIFGFKYVPITYFPDSSRLQVMIDYWAPEGTRIQAVSSDVQKLEKKLLADPGVASVSTFIGQGPPRFYLPVESEFPYSSYAQLIVNVKSMAEVDKLITTLPAWNKTTFPQSMVRVRKYAVGAFNNWKIAARFSGPANASPAVLRQLADEAVAILKANPNTIDVRTDWRERVLQIVPLYQQERARWANISRLDLAQTLSRASDGIVVGLYREQDDLIPILLRQPQSERDTAAIDLPLLQINSQVSTKTVPVSQVTDGIKLEWTDPIIWRWDRKRAVTVQCSPNGVTANTLRESILPKFEQIKLPPGYTLTWDGEYKSSKESAEALKPGLFPSVIIMLLIIVLLFNAYRPMLIIIAVIPFAMIGITSGLLITGVSFGFIALLGAMSLSGMMIKNSVVLLDQVNINLAQGMKPYDAVIQAGISRLSPVVNAALTTILGVIPLLQDVFWVSLAVTIIFGLTFGTILTMFLVPTLYCIFYKVKSSTDPQIE
ncbi:efflux RND transporter permease subunit [Legionella bononiensis]|uniref:Efflux RND transporter permease subunit n=1 Tax=Legionella bononiensis TaxID=2793102 RepID=A0ABS1W6M4_9GAMM|nr:efflux RND transporter permease subunit [Legionella bononiensis]MBL7478424.1 efflux RND transporter permease subunit [Legionella bononiensis]MBL7525021.1 efflux RND transporter permease subunit [Legionella bononiensis]MBL7561318.1 efflux RND transporter permease subunit [Legionella bononiensis]